MERLIACVGDPLTSGGQVLPYPDPTQGFTIQGHQPALIGGQAYCAACKSNGVINKAGGPKRWQYIAEVALENDIVICGCPVPPKIIAALQQISYCDDMYGAMDAIQSSLTTSATSASSYTCASEYANYLSSCNDSPDEYEQYFVVQDEHGNPLPGFDYQIMSEEKIVAKGSFNTTGETSAYSLDQDIDIVLQARK